MQTIKELNSPLYVCDVKATTQRVTFVVNDAISTGQYVDVYNASAKDVYIKGSKEPENLAFPSASVSPAEGKIIPSGGQSTYRMGAQYTCINVVATADSTDKIYFSIGAGA